MFEAQCCGHPGYFCGNINYFIMIKRNHLKFLFGIAALLFVQTKSNAQIQLLQTYKNYHSASIGTYQGIHFREGGFSSLYPIAGSNGTEFWTCSDRGVNIDAANANTTTCRPKYDKIFPFPDYSPKIHRLRVRGDSIQIIQTIPIRRPNGNNATGLINPSFFGSTVSEIASTDTVLNCSNFQLKTAAKDTFGIDCEGIAVDKDGNFLLCEEGGPTIWKLNKSGILTRRYSPYANLNGAHPVDVLIDTVFKYRKNNRGFEGIAITPNGKIYAAIQSPLLYPTKTAGENTRIHRLLEIDPINNTSRVFVYLNDGIIGKGADQIRLRDWKIGDLFAINDNELLVAEAALRGKSDIKRIYRIDLSKATPVHSGLYGYYTLEELVDSAGLATQSIVPVTKTLVMDINANQWPSSLEKAEGIAILNDSTLAISNDNDFGQISPDENGIAKATGILSQILIYHLKGKNKINRFKPVDPVTQGLTGPSTNQSPYLLPSAPGVQFTSILSANESINGYTLCGIPDGLGAFDNGDGTFSLFLNHEFGVGQGSIRAHGSKGAFISKWTINKTDLKVIKGEDLIRSVQLWNGKEFTAGTTLFGRLCSADLPPYTAFYNKTGNVRKGTMVRMLLNGEENGLEGRAFAHLLTGYNEGTSFELPYLGKASWENVVANPESGDKTVVALLDDSNNGQVYFYIGTKSIFGKEIDKAGLTKGKLYGVKIDGYASESDSILPAANASFKLLDHGQVHNMSGADLNTLSGNLGVTSFKRPEDGSWIPGKPNEFYFVTTNAFNAPSRLWKLVFSDIKNPELGGTIELMLNGTEGQKMLDNLCADQSGHLLLQEDPGNNAHIAKIWQYSTANDQLKLIGEHDPTRFLNGAPNFLTQDEESSGIIDVRHILGNGMFLLTDQSHYPIPNEVVEGGQLLAMFNPDSYKDKTPTYTDVDSANEIQDDSDTNSEEISNAVKPLTSEIVLTRDQQDGSPSVRVYPNPAITDQFIGLELKQFTGQIIEVSLKNISGKLFWKTKMKVNTSIEQEPLACGVSLPRGIYIISVSSSDHFYSEKLIIE